MSDVLMVAEKRMALMKTRVSGKECGKVIRIISKEIKKFTTPIVTKVGQDGNPFLTLISCILSLRTKDSTTADASRRLFAVADNPADMAKLPVNRIQKLIYPVGFYRTKAKNIIKVCNILLDQYHSSVPRDFDKLMELPNVGRKTANIVMVYGFFDKNYLPIDIHCHRIPNRLGWIRTKTPEETEFALKKLIPKHYWWEFNNSFVAFGQNICKPVGPLCWKCPIISYCRYGKKSLNSNIKRN